MKTHEIHKNISAKVQPYSIRLNRYSRRVFIAIICLAVELIFFRSIIAYKLTSGSALLNDFDVFYAAGALYWSGNIIEAYDSQYFISYMTKILQKEALLLWTYPPQFIFVSAALSLIPPIISYAVFMISSSVIFFIVIYRISGDFSIIPLSLTVPVIIMAALTGQNSFFISSLTGIFCISALISNSPKVAGLFLGLMIFKAHLAIGIGWFVLLKKNWCILLTAVLVIVVSSFISTLTFGIPVWFAFSQALEEASTYLGKGLYPMDRMSSIYAFVYTATEGSNLYSAIAHFSFMLIAFGLCAVSILQSWEVKRSFAIACLATLSVSPYCYDYDTLIAAVAFSIVARDLIFYSSLIEKVFIFMFSWLMTGWGLVSTFLIRETTSVYEKYVSLGGLGLVGVTILLFMILLRAQRTHS